MARKTKTEVQFVTLDTFSAVDHWNLDDRMAFVTDDRRVVIRWSSRCSVRHVHVFDDMDGALRMMLRVNEAGRISTSQWETAARA